MKTHVMLSLLAVMGLLLCASVGQSMTFTDDFSSGNLDNLGRRHALGRQWDVRRKRHAQGRSGHRWLGSGDGRLRQPG